jgi:transcriptional regulator with XRE-family HTH domain
MVKCTASGGTRRDKNLSPRELGSLSAKGLFPAIGSSSQLFNIVACAETAVKIVAPLWGAMPHLFAAKLRYVRHQQGLTLREFADKVAFASYQYLWLLEKDQRSPSLEMVVLIAAFFNQSADYFLRDTIAVEVPSPSAPIPLVDIAELPRLFGERLRALRLQHGWGQTELARRLNLMRRGYISNLESGRKTPSLDLIVQIADLFELTIDSLLRENDTPASTLI